MAEDSRDERASHRDRDRAVEALRIAAGDGRIDTDELDARLERALAARTLGELAELTGDLGRRADDEFVIEQVGATYVKDGGWRVPARIRIRTSMSRVTLDFTRAVITADVLHIDAEMVHGKLRIVSAPGMVIDADGLTRTYSKAKLRPTDTTADPRLLIKLTGSFTHAKLIERRRRP